jgi:hypothetical protein
LGLVWTRRGAERLRRFLGRGGEIALVRVDSRIGHVSDPVLGSFLATWGNKCALGVSLPLERAGIDVKLQPLCSYRAAPPPSSVPPAISASALGAQARLKLGALAPLLQAFWSTARVTQHS